MDLVAYQVLEVGPRTASKAWSQRLGTSNASVMLFLLLAACDSISKVAYEEKKKRTKALKKKLHVISSRLVNFSEKIQGSKDFTPA